jgi:hypothetical protein
MVLVPIAQEDLRPQDIYIIRRQIVQDLQFANFAQVMEGTFLHNQNGDIEIVSIFMGTQPIEPVGTMVTNRFVNGRGVAPQWTFWREQEPIPIPWPGGRRKRTHAKRKRRTLKKRRRTRRTR